MTTAELKAKFKTGSIPTETDFANLIDMIPNNSGGGDIDLSNPAKPTLKYLKNIRTVLGTNTDVYLVFDVHDGIESVAFHLSGDNNNLEIGYGTLSYELDNPNYDDDSLLNDLKLSDFQYKLITGNSPIVANGSYNGTSGHYVFNLATIKKTEIPVTIIFINSNVNGMWYRSKSISVMDEKTWNKIKTKISNSQDFSSDITGFLDGYTKL